MRAGNGGEGTRDQQPPPSLSLSLSFVTLRGEKRREDGDMAQSRVKEVEGGDGETGRRRGVALPLFQSSNPFRGRGRSSSSSSDC